VLDGRTDLHRQHEAVAGWKDVAFITVRDAEHDLFDRPSEEMLDLVDSCPALPLRTRQGHHRTAGDAPSG
jgi:hypothetical protein